MKIILRYLKFKQKILKSERMNISINTTLLMIIWSLREGRRKKRNMECKYNCDTLNSNFFLSHTIQTLSILFTIISFLYLSISLSFSRKKGTRSFRFLKKNEQKKDKKLKKLNFVQKKKLSSFDKEKKNCISLWTR